MQRWPAIIALLGYDPIPQPQSVPELLKAIRRHRGWTQEQLAEQLGVAVWKESLWECGLGRPEECLVARLDEQGAAHVR